MDKQCLPCGVILNNLLPCLGTHRELYKCHLSLLSKVIPELWEINTKKNHFLSPKLNASTSTWEKIEEYELLVQIPF